MSIIEAINDNRKRQTKPQKLLRWVTSQLDVGNQLLTKVNGNKHVSGPHANCKRDIRAFPRHPGWFRINRMRGVNCVAHLASENTIYFAGQTDNRQPYTLALVDIDCRRFGSPEGARQFSEFLTQNVSQLAAGEYEPSTGGKGGHLFFVVDKEGMAADRSKEPLKRLEKHLSAYWRMGILT